MLHSRKWLPLVVFGVSLATIGMCFWLLFGRRPAASVVRGSSQAPYRVMFHGPRSAREERVVLEAQLDAQVHWLEFTGSTLVFKSTVDIHLMTDAQLMPNPRPLAVAAGHSWMRFPLCDGASDLISLALLYDAGQKEKPSLSDRFFTLFADPLDRPAEQRAPRVDYLELQSFIEEAFLEAAWTSVRETKPGYGVRTALLEALRADTSEQFKRENLRERYVRQATLTGGANQDIQFPLCPAAGGCEGLTPWIIPAMRFVRDQYGPEAALKALSKVTSGADLPENTPAATARQFDLEFGAYLATKYEIDKGLPRSMAVRRAIPSYNGATNP